MKIAKMQESKSRILLADGEVDGKHFNVFVLADGSGIVLELEYGAYLLTMDEIVKEILANKDNE